MRHKIPQTELLLAKFLNYMQIKRVQTLVKQVILKTSTASFQLS